MNPNPIFYVINSIIHYGRKLFHLAKIVKNLHSLNTIETLLPTLLIFL